MGHGRLAGALSAALLVAACSTGADDTEVLGAVVEASPRGALTATPAPAATSPSPSPSPVPSTTPEPMPEATPEPTPEPTPTATPVAAPAPADPVTASPRLPATPAAPVEHLGAGAGWSTNTLLPDEGGEAWTEVSGQPPVGPDGASEARLFVALAHDPVPGDSAGRFATCQAWLEAAPAADLRAAGAVTVELLVGGVPVRTATHEVDGTVPAGARADLPPSGDPERVHALEREAVTCTATYTPSG